MKNRVWLVVGAVLGLLAVAFVVFLNPTFVAPFDGSPHLKLGEKYDVRILRDTWGVPHVYGKTDADVAFGLAYAHAEDDFKTIQQSLMTSRGRLALVDNQTPRLANALTTALGAGTWFETEGADPAVTDYLVQLLKVRERVDGQMKANLAEGKISTKAYDVLSAYAAGITLYAAE